MDWIVFSYSLPTQASSIRVSLWRRLRRLGAISPAGGVYVLPAREDCVESFQWLALEIRQSEGEALVMHVPRFDGLDDGELIALFNQSREQGYEELSRELADLERLIDSGGEESDLPKLQSALQRLQKQHADLARIDYFQSAHGTSVAARLNQLSLKLSPDEVAEPKIARATAAQYQSSRWVTRPRPHVDRLACAWLIHRYLNRDAHIRYSLEPERDEVAFDMANARFSHQGNLCTFEVMMRAFELDKAALCLLAQIVHEIDLRDGRFQRPETAGIDAALRGWLLADMPDDELEAHGLALFDGLYAALSQSDDARATSG